MLLKQLREEVLEANLEIVRRGLVLSDGNIAPFFTRPICMGFATVTIFVILLYVPAFKALVQKVTGAIGAQFKSMLPHKN